MMSDQQILGYPWLSYFRNPCGKANEPCPILPEMVYT
jgi:hypothetical protein